MFPPPPSMHHPPGGACGWDENQGFPGSQPWSGGFGGRQDYGHTHEGYRVEEAAFQERPPEPEHLKAKRLSWGGHAYGLSSPFEFSDPERAPVPPPMVQPVMQQVQQVQMHVHVQPEPMAGTQLTHSGGVMHAQSGLQHRAGGPAMRPMGPRGTPPMPPAGYFESGPPPRQMCAPRPPPAMVQPMVQPMMQQPPPQAQVQMVRPASHQPPQEHVGRGQGDLSGWLGKRGTDFASPWQNRWCRLDGATLSYSHTEGGHDERSIQLDICSRIVPIADPHATPEGRALKQKKPHAFEIYNGPGKRTWYFDAGSPEKMLIWCQALNRNVAQLGGGGGGGYAVQPVRW